MVLARCQDAGSCGRWLLLASLAFLVLFPVALPPSEATANTSFIQVQDAGLSLSGTRVRIIGGNSYGILSGYLGIGYVTTGVPNSTQRFVDAAATHLRTLRFWLDVAPSDYWFGKAYEIFTARTDHADYFGAFDRLLADARATGILLVPVFVSAYDQWTKLGNNTNFWTVGSATNVKFKEWVSAMVTHYRNEPQIAWWELANEPNYFRSLGLSQAGQDEVIAWAKDLVALIRNLDANHLVEGGYNNVGPLDTATFDALNSFVDIASSHIYDKDLYAWEAGLGITEKKAAVNDFVKRFTDRAKQVLGKPILWGEFNGDFADPNNPYPEYFLEAVHTRNSDAALIWSWEEGYASGDPYYVSPSTRPAVVASLTKWSDMMQPAPTTSSSTSSSSSPLNVAVGTDKATYRRGDRVRITVTVTEAAGGMVAGASVQLKIVDPTGKTITVSVTTNSAAVAQHTYRLSWSAALGSWALGATANATGYSPGTASTTFTVRR